MRLRGRPHLAAVLQQGRKSANNHTCLAVISRSPVEANRSGLDTCATVQHSDIFEPLVVTKPSPYLGVTTGLVSQWERGEKHPRGASLKLLTLVAKKGLQAVA